MADSKNVLLRSKKRRAEELLRTQRLPEARDLYTQLCHHSPNDYESWVTLGVINGQLGVLHAAEAAFTKALSLRRNEPRLYINLIRLCEAQGRLEDALGHCQNYLRLKPDDAEAHAQTGILLYRLGQLEAAWRALQQALQLNPGNASYHNNAGLLLSDLGRDGEALNCYQRAVELNPMMDEAHCNLGDLYRKQSENVAAQNSYIAAIKINPANVRAYSNLGFCYLLAERNSEAMHCFNEVLKREPDNACIHWNIALLLLLLGEYRRGWQEYEWRFKHEKTKRPVIIERYLSKPLWDGTPLGDRTLLVYAEQGFGDSLQFCRFLPLVKERAEHLLFECQPELLSLLKENATGIELIARPADGALPALKYDVQIPLMSLPRLFNIELNNLQQSSPYLHAEPLQITQWQQRLSKDTFNVGLVWAGNPEHNDDKLRSISLAQLAPLANIPGVVFYSLQKGSAAAELSTPPAGMELIDLAPELNDFATTAAVITALDLVITVDTAVAHLAGALGKPVWTLIYSPTDWRWLLEREESPWYATMRLFRQSQQGEWGSVITTVATALRQISVR